MADDGKTRTEIKADILTKLVHGEGAWVYIDEFEGQTVLHLNANCVLDTREAVALQTFLDDREPLFRPSRRRR